MLSEWNVKLVHGVYVCGWNEEVNMISLVYLTSCTGQMESTPSVIYLLNFSRSTMRYCKAIVLYETAVGKGCKRNSFIRTHTLTRRHCSYAYTWMRNMCIPLYAHETVAKATQHTSLLRVVCECIWTACTRSRCYCSRSYPLTVISHFERVCFAARFFESMIWKQPDIPNARRKKHVIQYLKKKRILNDNIVTVIHQEFATVE